MTADPGDDVLHDLLRRVVAELQSPVSLDPALDARVLDIIRMRNVRPARSRWIVAGGGATLAAGIALALFAGFPGKGSAAETRQVSLRLSAPASHVAIVGDFNDWDPAATPLRPTADPGVWIVELRLKPGRYHYSFLLDGQRWVPDPAEPPAMGSDFGAPTSVLTVS